MTTKPRRAGSDTPQPEDQFDLVTAYERVLERERQRMDEALEVPEATDRSERGKVIMAGVLSLISLYLWVGQPAWLMPPPDPPPPLAEQEQARALGVRLQAVQIEQFREQHGRLPANLEEVGPVLPGVAFHPEDGGAFSLEVPGGGGIVDFRPGASDSATFEGLQLERAEP